METNNVTEIKVLTTAEIAKIFVNHVDAHKQINTDRSDYFDFARAIEQEVLKKAQEK